ncbi:adenosine receptor A2b-like [Anneissia japonica]|uniref:adenosine receptor A2b-like n=1 Tax=Anneissia japonica TaxID=1529436 RepID=UPI00142571B6|nr:adenosine receptor A2b-like [Anneissia japonica]
MATVDLLVQDDVSIALVITVCCLNVPLMLAIVFGNLIVILSIYRKRALAQTPSNIFMSSLALADIMTGLIGVPFSIVGYLLRKRFLYSVNCAIWYFVPCIIFIHVSVFNLIVITLDRFLAIRYPLRYHVWIAPERAIRICVFVYFLGTFLGSSSFIVAAVASIFLPTPNVTFEYDCGSSAFYEIYGAPVFYYVTNPVAGLTIPCLFILYLYIFSIASKKAKEAATRHGKKLLKREMKVTKTTAIVLLTYTLCIAPTAFKNIVQGYIDNGSTWLAWYPWFSDFLAITNSMLNPFIYAGRSKEMRKEFKITIKFIVSILCPRIYKMEKDGPNKNSQRWSSKANITTTTTNVEFSDEEIKSISKKHNTIQKDIQ